MSTPRHLGGARALGWAVAAMLVLVVAPVATADAKKFQVVVFGDSYGSGEGAPAVNGDYGSDGGALRDQGVKGLINPGSRPFPDPAADWNGNAADQAFTGDGSTAARRCHRSPKATAPRAVRLLADQFPDIDFTFRSFACSGARIDEGPIGSYEAAQPIDPENRVPSQISQANDYLNAPPQGTDKRIDALVMNIGGNNLGFGNIIQRCLNLPPYQGFEPCSPGNVSENGIGNDDTLRVLQTGEGSGEPVDVIGLDNLPGLYSQLNKKINRVPGTAGKLAVKPRNIYLTTPTNPVGGGRGGCLTGQYDYEKSLRADEHAWLRDTVFPTLVDAMSDAADAHEWELVELGPAAPANGMCVTQNRMFNRNRDALRRQGATVASAAGIGVSHGIGHPNSAGYVAMAPILAARLRTQVTEAFTPGQLAVGGAEPAPVVALGNRVQLRLADPPEDYLTRPAGSGQFSDLAVGSLGMGIGMVDVPVPTTVNSMSLLARRCGPLSPSVAPPAGCGAARPVFDVLTGTPGVPTGVTGSANLQGVTVNWTQGSAAGRTLRRFLITASSSVQVTTPGGTLTVPVTQNFSIAPDLRTSVLPLEAGDWSISVRECTDRGCGNGSATLNVRSIGVFQFDPQDLERPVLRQLQQFSPVGVFTTPAGRRPRAGKLFPLQISWGVWRHWKDLRELRVRMVGERGELGTILVKLGSGRVTVRGPGSRTRRGKIGRRGVLRAKKFALSTRKARIVGSGKRGRLVALKLPLALSKTLRRQRVDVDVAASSRGGKKQGFGPAGSFEVRRARRSARRAPSRRG
ncbi:MAG TPA: hypothetical protein VFD31_02930 [Thermoleophilaceae bacterium]|nr:hypothetical protein [Thermoleophilaceae bacterium]